jgi:AbiV family abortive infection protein
MPAQNFKKLEAYTGQLTPAQAAAGIEAAVVNARSLLVDAQLLFDAKRWSRVASLAILAIEEAGKIPFLRELLVLPESELKNAWRSYRSHTEKNVLGGFLDHVESSPNIEDYRPLYDKENDHPRVLDAVKQLGFYSDCLGKCHWSLPAEVVNEELAKSLLLTAKTLIPDGESAMQSAPELELWVKHLRPVWRKDMALMKRALIDCYQEASDLGVLRGKQTVEEMVRFLL